MDQNELKLRKYIRKSLLEHYENDNLGNWTDFDANEFSGEAMKAAKSDIENSGEKFVPLGKSKFEKKMNINDMMADLEADSNAIKYNLPKHKSLEKTQKQIDHLNKFGSGSLNEKYYFPTQEDINKQLKKLEAEKIGKSGKELSNIEYKIKSLKNNLKENTDLKPTNKVFTGQNSYKEAIQWGKDNLPNFNSDMVRKKLDSDEETWFISYIKSNNLKEISQLDRPKDAKGHPITLNARVENISKENAGHVVRFGVDDNNKQTVHVSWISNFGAPVPPSVTYPDKIIVKDNAKIVREVEIISGNNNNIGKVYTNEEGIKYWAEKRGDGKWTVFSKFTWPKRDEFESGLSNEKDAIDMAKILSGHTNEEDPEAYFMQKHEGSGIGLNVKKGMNVKPFHKK